TIRSTTSRGRDSTRRCAKSGSPVPPAAAHEVAAAIAHLLSAGLSRQSHASGMTFAPGCATSFGKRCLGEGGAIAGGALDQMDADTTRAQLAAALVRVAGGDRAALRIVYQDTSAKLFGVCLRILKDRSEAEDVLQDVYLTVWRKAATFDPGRASPITCMVAIARNRAIGRLGVGGSPGRLEPIEATDVVSDPAPSAVERVELAQQHQRLARCLEELEARHSTAIRAAFLDGATYEELAAHLNVPLG